MDFSELLKRIRKQNKLTQKELANLTGLSIATIQGYEQKKFLPKIGQLQKLANALNISALELTTMMLDKDMAAECKKKTPGKESQVQ